MQRHRKPYWFKRKWYGRGRYPASWQGWLISLLFLGAAIAWATTLPVSEAELANYDWQAYLGMYLPLGVMIGGLILICYLRGEKPTRQWGKPRDEENDQ